MRIMVLNDDETFTDLEGCMIVELPDGLDTEAIEALLRENGGTEIHRFARFDIADRRRFTTTIELKLLARDEQDAAEEGWRLTRLLEAADCKDVKVVKVE